MFPFVAALSEPQMAWVNKIVRDAYAKHPGVQKKIIREILGTARSQDGLPRKSEQLAKVLRKEGSARSAKAVKRIE